MGGYGIPHRTAPSLIGRLDRFDFGVSGPRGHQASQLLTARYALSTPLGGTRDPFLMAGHFDHATGSSDHRRGCFALLNMTGTCELADPNH